jgi:stage III sporulation protein AG
MSKNDKIDKGKWQKIIILGACGALGICLLLFGSGGSGTEKSESDPVYELREYDAQKYAEELEGRVRELCSRVRGVGEVSVLVSLKGGYRTVYAFDTQSSSSGYKSEIVLSGGGSDKNAIVCAYENPEIAGIGVVCDGGDDAYVRQQIISLVSAALDVSSNKIFVASSH